MIVIYAVLPILVISFLVISGSATYMMALNKCMRTAAGDLLWEWDRNTYIDLLYTCVRQGTQQLEIVVTRWG